MKPIIKRFTWTSIQILWTISSLNTVHQYSALSAAPDSLFIPTSNINFGKNHMLLGVNHKSCVTGRLVQRVHENRENCQFDKKCCHFKPILGLQNGRFPVGTRELTAINRIAYRGTATGNSLPYSLKNRQQYPPLTLCSLSQQLSSALWVHCTKNVPRKAVD